MVSLFPHPASFRFRLTMDTLAFGYLLPATGRIRVFHPLETCAVGRINKKGTNLWCLPCFLHPHRYRKAAFEVAGVRIRFIWWR